MDDTTRNSAHSKFAGRKPAGADLPIILSKNGNRQIRRLPNGKEEETLSVGLACSECFSGSRLAKLLQPGFEYEKKVMENLMAGDFAAPLSIHTSAGVPEALSDFINALEPHLPWDDADSLDWCVSLQLEGASAVWAGVDMLLQERILSTGDASRKKVAVGGFSYHGPPSTSFGSKEPMWRKHYQLKYPVPTPGIEVDDCEMLNKFEQFLDAHAMEIGVLLIEPQWGSSQAAFPWPKNLLKSYIEKAHDYGIRVLADEIMCGLGRHGKGTVFISKAWDLNPDAVTFGKSIAGGVYPLSGAIIKKGRDVLQLNKCSVMQSHTYAGSSTRALMTATAVLNELPNWIPSAAKLGEEMSHIFSYLSRKSKGMIIAQGQGLMWGCLFSHEGKNADDKFRSGTFQCFQKNCEEIGIIPYFVPIGGFMVTPLMDIDVGTIYEIGEKLEAAIRITMEEREWEPSVSFADIKTFEAPEVSDQVSTDCVPLLHKTRSCTSCTSFVCKNVRMRFMI